MNKANARQNIHNRLKYERQKARTAVNKQKNIAAQKAFYERKHKEG